MLTGREGLTVDVKGICNELNFCFVPWNATDVAESRPTKYGKPAFLSPPPEARFVMLETDPVRLV